jgi:AAA ATPase domain/Trypsin-like peptidase domain
MDRLQARLIVEGLNPERVVAILTPVPTGGYELGSGYVIDRTLVLTARHVVTAADTCEVRRLVRDGHEFDLGTPLEARVLWRGRQHDAALVQFSEQPEVAPERFGRIEGVERVPCHGVGFPHAQLKPGKPDRRDTEELSGQIAPLTSLRSRALTVHIDGNVPLEDRPGHSPWDGISGAALFAGPLLVGVVNVHPRCFGTSRLEAVPVAALAEDPEFAQVFRHETGREFTVESAAEPALALPAGVVVMNFLQQYLGDGDRVVPFAGRDLQLGALDAWLEDASCPNLLLTGLPGRGKSALLARWWQRLERDSDRTRAAFVPITVRYELNREADVLAAAVARLAAAQGEDLAPSSSPADLREQLGSLLTSPPPAGRKTVLILDGLDEAVDWKPWRSLLPLRPADGVKVLVSARLTATHSTAAQWLDDLGWEEPASATVSVEKLSPAGTGAVIESAGPAHAAIAGDPELVGRLHATVDGDPLVLGLYLRHLRSAAVTDPRAAVRDLDPTSVGLDGFIERWWKDQRKLWGAGVGTREPAVRTTFNVLAAALGPLEQAGLLALVRREHDIGGDELHEAIEDLERMVIYEWPASVALSHPRIGAHRLEQLRNDGELERYEELFLGWGRETLADLIAGKIEPSSTPAYPILHYRGHLDRLRRERGISDEVVDSYLELSAPVWLRAWEQAVDQSAGYLEDVDAARRAAGEADAAAVAQGRGAPFIAEEIRCALVRAEQESSFALVQGELLGSLVAERIWSERRAIAACEGIEGPWPRAESLAAVIPHLGGRDLRRVAELLPELAETEEVHEDAVARFARRLAETEGAAAARGFADELESGRAAALLGLLPLAPAEDRVDLVRSVWAELEEGAGSSELLERLTGTVDLELAREALGPRPAERLSELLREKEWWWPPQGELEELEGVKRAYAMAHRGAWLDPAEAATETATILGRILDEGQRFNVDEALACLVPYLGGDLHPVALAVIDELVDEDRRPVAWAILLDADGGAERNGLLERAVAGLAEIQKSRSTSDAADFLATLARHGAAEACLDRVAELEGDEGGQFLAALAPHLDATGVRRALELVRQEGPAPPDSATQALLARLGSFGAAAATEALELAAAPAESAETRGAVAALSQIVSPRLELAGFLPLAGDPLRQAALAIGSRSATLTGGDLLQTVLCFRAGLYPLRLDPSEDGAAALFAEMQPRLSDQEIAGEPAQRAAEMVIAGGGHARKDELVVLYMRRLAAAAGAPMALALGKRLSTPGSGRPLALTWAIIGAAGACRDGQEAVALGEAAGSIDHGMSRAAAKAALLAREPAGPGRDALYTELVEPLDPADVELSPGLATLFFDALPDEYRDPALRRLVPDELLTGTSQYTLDAVWAEQMAHLARVLELDQARQLHGAAAAIGQSGARAKLRVATAARIGVLGHLDEAIDGLASISPEHLEPALRDLFESAPDAELARLIEFTAERLSSPWYGERRAWVWVAASRRVEALAPEQQLRLLQSWLDRDPSREQILVDLLLFAPTILRLGGGAACEELSGRVERRS